MKEETVMFDAGGIRLEGRITAGTGRGGAVVSHPHPQMGGSMDNNVVEAVCEGFQRLGFTTLRFNFRGAGRSEGRYDGGRGEQDDLRAAVDFLAARISAPVLLGGYSFGAWVTANLCAREPLPYRLLLVSPPIDLLETPIEPLADGLIGVICGDRDAFCDIRELTKRLEGINLTPHVMAGADHFYIGREEVLASAIEKILIPFLKNA